MRTPREHECGDPFDSRQNDRHVRPSSRSPCPFPRPQFRSSLIFGPPTTDSAVPSGIPACDCPYFSVTRTGPPTANWREVLRDHLVLAPHQLSDLPCQVDRRTSPPPATVSVTRHHYLGAMEPVTRPRPIESFQLLCVRCGAGLYYLRQDRFRGVPEHRYDRRRCGQQHAAWRMESEAWGGGVAPSGR